MISGLNLKTKIGLVDSYVSKRLRMRRMMLGLNQKNLAEAVNVSIQQIQKYEKATNRISSGKLYGFANLLKVSVNYFFEKVDTEQNNAIESINTYALAEDQEPFLPEDNASEKEIVTLIKAFNEITDPEVRKKIIDLVKTLKTEPNL